MKKFYSLLITFFAISSSFAQNTAIVSGDWDDAKTWSAKHIPANNEQVDIPAGITVEVNDNQQIPTTNLDVRVFGKLVLNNGKLSIGDNSTITLFATGSLVSLKGNSADKIDIGGIQQYIGSFGTLYGPLVATSTTNGFKTIGYTILPVKFVQFSVANQNNQVLVQWATAEEKGATYFEVERSTNGTSWSTIAQVKAAGNSSQQTNYSYIDKNTASGTVYYRVKQTDTNGSATYTAIQSLRMQGGSQVNIIAAQNLLAVQFTKQVQGKVEVVVVNHAGQVVTKQVIQNPVGQVTLPTANLKGAYFVAIQSVAGICVSKQVVL